MISWRERGRRAVSAVLPWIPLALPLYLIRFRIGGLPTTLLELLLLALLATFTYTERAEGWQRGWERMGKWRGVVVAWVLTTIVAVVAAPQLFAGFGLWRAYVLEPVLVFVVLQAVLTEEWQRQRLQRTLLLVVFPLVTWAVVQFITGKGIHIRDVFDRCWPAGNKTISISQCTCPFVTRCGVPFAAWVRYPRRVLSLMTFIVSVIGILLVRSDGGLVGLLAAMTLTLLGVRWGRWLVAAGTTGAIVLLGFIPSIRTVLWQELTFQGWSGRVRVWMWTETWQMLKDHWFFGAGFGGYPTVFDPYHKKRFIEIFQYPHTLVFNFWSETGLLGLAAFTGVVVRWIKECLQVWRKQRSTDAMIFFAPLVALLVHGLVGRFSTIWHTILDLCISRSGDTKTS
jgi:O-antigen ligase